MLTLFTCKYLLICSFKDFPDSLMDDRTSKNILSYTVTYTALPIYTDLHFKPNTVLATKFPTDFN